MKTIDSFDGEHRFLSNFFPCNIEYDGMVFPSTEHAYQAAKTKRIYEREDICEAKSPGKAKGLGQLVKKRPDWDLVKNKSNGGSFSS